MIWGIFKNDHFWLTPNPTQISILDPLKIASNLDFCLKIYQLVEVENGDEYFFIALKTICTLRRGKKRKKIRLIFGPKNEKSRFLTVFLKMHLTKNRKIESVEIHTPKQPLPDRMTHFLAS